MFDEENNETLGNEPAYEFLLGDVARLFKIVFNQRAQPRLGLTQSQSRTLIHLKRNEGINQAGLAEILEVQPITLARTIDRLEADGWMERRADPKDRRAFTLHLLPKAEPALDDMRSLALMLRADIFKTLSEDERAAFGHALEVVRQNLNVADLRTSSAPGTPGRKPENDNQTADHAAALPDKETTL